MIEIVALKRAFWFGVIERSVGRHLLGAGVFGDGLGAFRNGVLGQLSREQKPDGGLDFAGCDRRTLVVVGQAGGFGGNTLKDVVDEAVHDAHGFRRNASVGVNLLQHLVDVDGVAFLPALLLLLLIALDNVLLGLAGFLRGLSAGFRCHRAANVVLDSKRKLKLMPDRTSRFSFIPVEW